MSDERLSIFQTFKESEQKFDYFIAGLVATTFAYSVQQVKIERIEWGLHLVEPFSLILLLLCLAAALRQIERSICIRGINYDIMYCNYQADVFHKSLKSPEPTDMDINTGEPLDDEKMIAKMEHFQNEGVKHRDALPNVESQLYFWRRIRNVLLVAGLGTLLISKMLPIEPEVEQVEVSNGIRRAHS
jgi:hypothetical protein